MTEHALATQRSRFRAIAVALGLSAPVWVGCGPQRPAEHAGVDHALVGSAAPAFELPTPDGKGTVALDQHQGKVVLVDFWATWCEPCKKSFPEYQKLLDRSSGKLVVIGVSVDEEPTDIGRFVAETGVRFPVAWDEGQSAAQAYSPPTMPTSFVTDKSGIVRFVHAGYRAGDEIALEQELKSLY